ncbi:MAG TPA: hypothetical protein PK856_07425 [Vitreoscilla sp.]|nr:hypothetical protein [Vitreoscilla sp.]
MKKSLILLAALLGTVGLAQAEKINDYDNVRIKEQGTITRQTTTQTDNMPAQVTTSTQAVERKVSVDPAPNFTIDGQPAYEIKEEVTTTPVEVSTEIIPQ